MPNVRSARISAFRLLPFVTLAVTAVASLTLSSVPAAARDGVALPALISGGGDKAIKRWDIAGKLVTTVGQIGDAVTALALVPDSPSLTIVSAGADNSLKMWDVEHSRVSLDLHPESVRTEAIALSPDGKTIATGGADHRIALWDSATGTRLQGKSASDGHERGEHGDTVRALQFTPDGALLVSGGADRMVRTWKVNADSTGAQLTYRSNIVAHDAAVTALAISANGQAIASVSDDGFLKTWRLDGALINRVRVSPRAVLCVAFSPDGKLIATGEDDGKIRLWNAETGAPAPGFAALTDRAVGAVAFSSDGKTLVSGGADGVLRYWAVAGGKPLASVAAHNGPVRAIIILP